MADFILTGHGSVWLLAMATPAARQWVAENISEEHQAFGNSIAIEPRYVEGVVAGIQADGLVVS